jgi:Uma2 family endonuclease
VTASATKLTTAEELLAMGDIGRCELIYGEIVMMSPAGLEHGVVAMRLGRYLAAHVDDNGLGVCPAAETGFKVASGPDLVRAPDASFIAKDRLRGALTRKYFEGVPDLAVEVISPDDSARDVSEKVNMWLAHGTRVVWVADPARMTVVVHRVGQTPLTLTTKDDLLEEKLLPGFLLPLSKVFKLP